VVVVADGANSRFGRGLGTQRDPATRWVWRFAAIFTSPYHDEPWIESHLDLRDRDGNYMPGYGWIFPVGDARSTSRRAARHVHRFKTVNTTKLMDAFVAPHPPAGHLARTSCGPPVGGKLPTGGSVTREGGTDLDRRRRCAGSINPFNGEGIAYAYEDGRMVADAVDEACAPATARRPATPTCSYARYGDYFKVARTFVRSSATRR